ncbi:alpha/beta hydrolase [Ponticoccus sp. SC2-23]|uniref:alpha/beta hydrolase n=1 Tax=Alexandriicola marinus TaxID=2081710 RepID=UPI000FD8D0CA|nr:alpha/beta hydrolase [Alexandriicola marinus]MBM1220554.1 alpha/beta hydrolase [Ponticoccus sp. SC6-9]MBM1225240.1 alpha/beta hydrolase [Ponticoccus sp. SC6-15]MBM1228754.1 alpha/beta hydrolase [Ponticoccus sp. SC6-38]MBM1233609.1 alpha/beta hydrolase [Ponticoccus sp. SC6-45]MBM1239255.1 alpha/beta hydrolase [Ponticoccus sp. SC6-49]MBM1243037.1 alpha/beta hydrolase [Ponticoccus sp. SC2-64]MBM1247133.1 alpha/beta hydrolase [Ponticoccus sp. SC6-42]MBM1252208.1 alpha/beta hydrolase [Pontico
MTYVAARTEGAPGAPLLFTFHGTGGTEAQLHQLGQDLVRGAHVVSPRGDVSENGALRFFKRTAEGVYDMDDLAERTAAMAEFIAAERKAVNAPSVIGLGYSNGANILANVGLTRPELVDDMILLHPLIPFDLDPQPGLDGRRILITAGEKDPICPADMTRSFSDYLQRQGAFVSEHWHEGGHELQQSELDAIVRFIS